jgi:hypothetical protein
MVGVGLAAHMDDILTTVVSTDDDDDDDDEWEDANCCINLEVSHVLDVKFKSVACRISWRLVGFRPI